MAHIPLTANVELHVSWEEDGEEKSVIAEFESQDPQQLMAKTMLINMINSAMPAE